jgi:hypothetical protein
VSPGPVASVVLGLVREPGSALVVAELGRALGLAAAARGSYSGAWTTRHGAVAAVGEGVAAAAAAGLGARHIVVGSPRPGHVVSCPEAAAAGSGLAGYTKRMGG